MNGDSWGFGSVGVNMRMGVGRRIDDHPLSAGRFDFETLVHGNRAHNLGSGLDERSLHVDVRVASVTCYGVRIVVYPTGVLSCAVRDGWSRDIRCRFVSP